MAEANDGPATAGTAADTAADTAAGTADDTADREDARRRRGLVAEPTPDALGELVRRTRDATPEWSRAIADAATQAGLGLVISVLDAGADRTARIVYVNGAAERILQASRDELVGRRPVPRLTPEEERRLRSASAQRSGGADPGCFVETTVLRPDGSEVPVEVGISLGHYWGRPAMVAFLRDVSERKAMEERLREREARFRGTWQTTDVGFYRVTPDGEVLEANPALLEMFGVDSLQALGELDVEEAFYPPDRSRDEWRAMVEASGRVRDAEATYLRRDGTPIHVRESVHVVRDDDGRVRWYEGTMEDVTDLVDVQARVKRANARLEASNQELTRAASLNEATLDATADGILVVDREGRIVDHNERFAQMWRVPEEVLERGSDDEAIACVVDQLKDPDAFLAKVRDLYDRPEAVSHDVLEFADGRIFEHDSMPQRLGDEVVGRVWSFRDVTSERRAKQELKRSNEELQEFAHVVSHDLREPVRMVSSFVKLLEKRYAGQLDEDADEFIGYAVEGAERMDAMIHALLEYARVGSRGTPLEPTDVGQVLEDACDNLRLRIDEVDAEVAAPERLPVVAGDRSQLVQLLQNLLDNALKYRAPDRPPRIEVTCHRADGGDGPVWTVRVADNGRGMDEATRETAFRIFRRGTDAEEAGAGSGIGLAVCQRIVERHGGRIWIESTPGEGTVVAFTLKEADGGTSDKVNTDGRTEDEAKADDGTDGGTDDEVHTDGGTDDEAADGTNDEAKTNGGTDDEAADGTNDEAKADDGTHGGTDDEVHTDGGTDDEAADGTNDEVKTHGGTDDPSDASA